MEIHSTSYTTADFPAREQVARGVVPSNDNEEERISSLFWIIPTVVFWAGIGIAVSSWVGW